jgi:maltose O-acetyltransferase
LFKRKKRNKLLRKKFPTLTVEEPVIIKGPIKNFNCGENVIIQSFTLIHLGGMEWCHNKGHLSIGNNSCISNHVTIFAAGPGGVYIGNNFDCAPGVKIFSSRTDIKDRSRHIFSKVRIEDNVIIYANAVINPGIQIGENVVIAAGAVVTENVPANSLVGGVPAKIIKHL